MQVSTWDECSYGQRDPSTYKPNGAGYRGLVIAHVLPCIDPMATVTSKERAAISVMEPQQPQHPKATTMKETETASLAEAGKTSLHGGGPHSGSPALFPMLLFRSEEHTSELQSRF